MFGDKNTQQQLWMNLPRFSEEESLLCSKGAFLGLLSELCPGCLYRLNKLRRRIFHLKPQRHIVTFFRMTTLWRGKEVPLLQAPVSRGRLRAGRDGLPATLHCSACWGEICFSQLLTEMQKINWVWWQDRGKQWWKFRRHRVFSSRFFPEPSHTHLSALHYAHRPCATCTYIIPCYHSPWRSEENLYLQVHWWLFIYGHKCLFTKVSLSMHQ